MAEAFITLRVAVILQPSRRCAGTVTIYPSSSHSRSGLNMSRYLACVIRDEAVSGVTGLFSRR